MPKISFVAGKEFTDWLLSGTLNGRQNTCRYWLVFNDRLRPNYEYFKLASQYVPYDDPCSLPGYDQFARLKRMVTGGTQHGRHYKSGRGAPTSSQAYRDCMSDRANYLNAVSLFQHGDFNQSVSGWVWTLTESINFLGNRNDDLSAVKVQVVN